MNKFGIGIAWAHLRFGANETDSFSFTIQFVSSRACRGISSLTQGLRSFDFAQDDRLCIGIPLNRSDSVHQNADAPIYTR